MEDNTRGIVTRMTTSVTPKGNRYILAIVIDNYNHVPALHNAVRDASTIIDILISKYDFKIIID